MSSEELVKQVRKAKNEFVAKCKSRFGDKAKKCTKFTGAVAVEILRHALQKEGFPVSQRDCFIDGIPIQVDLFITKPDVQPIWDLLYAPDDVLVALEVKQTGAFPGAITKVKSDFDSLLEACPRLTCAYVAIEERNNYSQAVTTENIGPLGHSVFTIATHQGDPQKGFKPVEGAWEGLLGLLRSKCCQT
ncbi:MAG: hypothetical protein WB930_18045 [Syntrophobacteraceae bacterium]